MATFWLANSKQFAESTTERLRPGEVAAREVADMVGRGPREPNVTGSMLLEKEGVEAGSTLLERDGRVRRSGRHCCGLVER